MKSDDSKTKDLAVINPVAGAMTALWRFDNFSAIKHAADLIGKATEGLDRQGQIQQAEADIEAAEGTIKNTRKDLSKLKRLNRAIDTQQKVFDKFSKKIGCLTTYLSEKTKPAPPAQIDLTESLIAETLLTFRKWLAEDASRTSEEYLRDVFIPQKNLKPLSVSQKIIFGYKYASESDEQLVLLMHKMSLALKKTILLDRYISFRKEQLSWAKKEVAQAEKDCQNANQELKKTQKQLKELKELLSSDLTEERLKEEISELNEKIVASKKQLEFLNSVQEKIPAESTESPKLTELKIQLSPEVGSQRDPTQKGLTLFKKRQREETRDEKKLLRPLLNYLNLTNHKI